MSDIGPVQPFDATCPQCQLSISADAPLCVLCGIEPERTASNPATEKLNLTARLRGKHPSVRVHLSDLARKANLLLLFCVTSTCIFIWIEPARNLQALIDYFGWSFPFIFWGRTLFLICTAYILFLCGPWFRHYLQLDQDALRIGTIRCRWNEVTGIGGDERRLAVRRTGADPGSSSQWQPIRHFMLPIGFQPKAAELAALIHDFARHRAGKPDIARLQPPFSYLPSVRWTGGFALVVVIGIPLFFMAPGFGLGKAEERGIQAIANYLNQYSQGDLSGSHQRIVNLSRRINVSFGRGARFRSPERVIHAAECTLAILPKFSEGHVINAQEVAQIAKVQCLPDIE